MRSNSQKEREPIYKDIGGHASIGAISCTSILSNN